MRIKSIFIFCIISLNTNVSYSAQCSRPVIVYNINTTTTEGFGKSQKYESLNLKKNEYILTFDDGPDAKITPFITKYLKENCIPAAFFMIGKKAESNPDLVKAAYEMGFFIGSHTYSHSILTNIPPDIARDEILSGMLAVERASGQSLHDYGRLFRFPSWSADEGLIKVVRGFGAAVAGADLSAEDWRGLLPERSLNVIKKQLRRYDRGVIVLHDNQENTIPLVVDLTKFVINNGGQFVGISTKN